MVSIPANGVAVAFGAATRLSPLGLLRVCPLSEVGQESTLTQVRNRHGATGAATLEHRGPASFAPSPRARCPVSAVSVTPLPRYELSSEPRAECVACRFIELGLRSSGPLVRRFAFAL